MGSLRKVELMALTNDAYLVGGLAFLLVSPQVFFSPTHTFAVCGTLVHCGDGSPGG